MGWEREGREGLTCMTSLVGGDELGERRKRGGHLYDFPGGRRWVGREKEERGSPVLLPWWEGMGWEREGREGVTCMTSLVGGDGLGERRKRGAHLYDFPCGRGWVGREKEERGSPA